MFCSKYDDKNFSYMDGISVKISEQYKPPKKISVPSGVLNRHTMEIEEYDFRLEKSMIKKMDEWRELRRTAAERRRQRLELEDQCGNGESKSAGVVGEGLSRLRVQSPEPTGIQPSQQQSQPSVTVPVSQQELPSYHLQGGEPGVQGVHSRSDPILTPVPVTSHNPFDHQTVLKKSFNISDFESDTSSPFDNMELKTINDIEELAYVLQPNLNSNNSSDTSCPSSSQPPPLEVNSPVTNHLTCNEPSSSSSISKNTDDTYVPRINGMNTLNYSNYNNLNSNHLWPQYNLLHHHNNHHHHSHHNHSYLGARNSTWAQSILPSSYNNPNIQSYVVQRLDHLETDHKLHQPSQVQHHNQMTTTQPSTETTSKSVPDIIQELVLELEDKRASEKQRSKKILQQPPRPSNVGPTEDELNKKSSLPNPLNQLSPSCQQLTLRLTEMGFPTPRVARTVERFGDNETKVLEFLLQVQHLEEGGSPPDRAEIALVINKYNLSETVRYLETLKQLLGLGFMENKVMEALEKHSNDRDKALESLIS